MSSGHRFLHETGRLVEKGKLFNERCNRTNTYKENRRDIKTTEDKLGPEQYKEINSAEIGEWTLYPIKDHRNLKKIWDDVVRQNTEVREEDMSKDLIAIVDGSGDKLCFKVNNGIMDNQIYICYHEDVELEEYASNLKEFIMLIS